METRTGFLIQLNDYQPGKIRGRIKPDSLVYCCTDQIADPANLTAALEQIINETHECESTFILQLPSELAASEAFGDHEELAYGLDVDYLHFDRSWTAEDIKKLALSLPSAVSVSGLSLQDRLWIHSHCPNVLFIHDYYRRKDTGLDQKVFEDLSEGIPKEEMVVFVPGTPLENRTGTELSTLENHRSQTSYAASVDLILQGIGGMIYTSDELSDMEMDMIQKASNGVFSIPASLNHPELYDQKFTIRSDSPALLKRLDEKPQGLQYPVAPDVPVARRPGFITMDNANDPESQGSIMICNGDYQADSSVNVIGHVCDYYLPVISLLENGATIEFLRPVLDGCC